MLEAIALMPVVAPAATVLSRGFSLKISPKLITMVVLFAVSVLAEAKQTILAFIPAVGVLLLSSGRASLRKFAIGGITALLLMVSAYFYQPLRMVTDRDLVLHGLGGKLLSFKLIAVTMLNNAASLFIGLGPGQSVSRAALAAQEGYVPSLPGGLGNLSLSTVTAEILSKTSEIYLFASSSVWSGISSWLGLFGDLGVLGVATYIWLLWAVWRGLAQRQSSWAHAGKAVLVMGALLGAMFSWLETPEFTLLWALYLSTGLVTRPNENFLSSQPLPTARR